MNLLKCLFQDKNKKKLLDVQEATSQQEVHDQKNQLTVELLKLHTSTHTIIKEAVKMKKTLDTATQIAIATGATKRGFSKK